MNKRKAIIIGASSGMGKALAILFSNNGYDVGLCARRLPLLEELKQQLPNRSYIREMDVTQSGSATAVLESLINEMGGLSKAYVSNFLQGLRYRVTRYKKENMSM